MTLNAWNGLPDPEAPKNLREGEPYNDPKFEDLARTYGIWGTAQAALCAQFWQAARRAPVVPQGWRLVPEVASEKMQRAIAAQFNGTAREALDAWNEALAAAPQPPDADHIEQPLEMVAAPDVADIIAGELETSRAHAYELMQQALQEAGQGDEARMQDMAECADCNHLYMIPAQTSCDCMGQNPSKYRPWVAFPKV